MKLALSLLTFTLHLKVNGLQGPVLISPMAFMWLVQAVLHIIFFSSNPLFLTRLKYGLILGRREVSLCRDRGHCFDAANDEDIFASFLLINL